MKRSRTAVILWLGLTVLPASGCVAYPSVAVRDQTNETGNSIPANVPQPSSGNAGASVTGPLITAVLSAFAALLGAMVGYQSTQRSSRAGIIQKTNELEIETLDRRLSQFVGPFMQLSEENKTLAGELKRSHNADDFRTLTALLTPGWRNGLSSGDLSLLAVIVANGVELRTLLMNKGAALVSPELIPYFSRASTHFRFLELAYKGSLDEDPGRFGKYVYPRELDEIMERELLRLKTRRELLRSAPYSPHARMIDLDLAGIPVVD